MGTIPIFLRVLSNYLLVETSPYTAGGMVAQLLGMKTDFRPQLVSVIFGVLLFFRGELLTSWAFPLDNEPAKMDC